MTSSRREKGSHSSRVHEEMTREAMMAGSVTHLGEEREVQGLGLDPLVDPSQHGVIRFSQNLLIPDEGGLLLTEGVAMPVKSDADTTGSMGKNIEIAFNALPKVQGLLVQGPNAVLRRYHTQIATGSIQDVVDKYPYRVSQFEPDNEVGRQMKMLFPERQGGDSTEDYQIGLFSTAFLTQTSISQYGLKGYYFVIGDEIGRDYLDFHALTRVFGPMVLEKAFGQQSSQSYLPGTAETIISLLQNWHVFFLQVDNHYHTTNWWNRLIGPERVVKLPRTEDLAEVQATIIGLTEGVLDLQNAADFLSSDAQVSGNYAQRIVQAVSEIPIAAQRNFANFAKIPMRGTKFASREDLWPIDANPTAMSEDPCIDPPGIGIDWRL
jgi:hypothetical protein